MLKQLASILGPAVRILTFLGDSRKKTPKGGEGVQRKRLTGAGAPRPGGAAGTAGPHPGSVRPRPPAAPGQSRANAPGWRDLGAGGDDAKASAPPPKSASPGRRWRQLSRGLKMTVALGRPSPGDSAPRSGGGGVSSRSPAAAAPAGRPAAAAAAAAARARAGGWGGGRALPAAAAQAPDAGRASAK